MLEKNNLKGWLYILPALLFLVAFMVYPLVDVFIYSFEENYSSASQTFTGYGFYNYEYVLHNDLFLNAVKNTLILVAFTVIPSTLLALLISVGLNRINIFKKAFQTIYFLPYVTNTIAVGLVFVILFESRGTNIGLFNSFLGVFGIEPTVWLGADASYAAKMFVLCIYTIWVVLPFKVIVLTSALASVNPSYYQAAKIDGTSKLRTFFYITVPQIMPMVIYLIITGFIGSFKAYNDVVALFGNDLDAQEINTIVGYVYNTLYSNGGYTSYASAAAVILFVIVLSITCINLLVSRKFRNY